MTKHPINYSRLANDIKLWGKELGFTKVGITNTDLSDYAKKFSYWLKNNYNADMNLLAKNKDKYLHPEKLFPDTKTIICVNLDYDQIPPIDLLIENGGISRYACRRDYHKIIRKKLQKLADKITEAIGDFKYRAFCDSAPVLEKALAEKAGIGWIGKNSCLINKEQGSWFFLGELFTNLSLPIDEPIQNHCGNCQLCIANCPTKALSHNNFVDANKCISYLTIENKNAIPENLQSKMDGWVFGCDACQSSCPYNKQTTASHEQNNKTLSSWTEEQFLKNTEGTPLRRINYQQWRRNFEKD